MITNYQVIKIKYKIPKHSKKTNVVKDLNEY